MMNPTVILLILLAVFAIILILIYNSLITKRNMADNAFSSIDAQLKKRYDLIPNLVASVKAYMKHESDILTKITEYRSQAMKNGLPVSEKVKLDNQISSVFRNIMVQMENYPELKASENIQFLERSLNETEAQLAAARRAFNAAVTEYNTSIQVFPTNLIAKVFGFSPRELFVIPEEERKNPNVGQLFS